MAKVFFDDKQSGDSLTATNVNDIKAAINTNIDQLEADVSSLHLQDASGGSSPAFPYLTEDQFYTFNATGGGMWDLDFNVYFLNKPLLYIIGDSNNPIAFQITNIPADLAFYETTLFLYEFGPNQSLKFLINGQFISDIGYSNAGFNGSVFMDFKLIKNHVGGWSCKVGPTSPNLILP